jgi:hypothetical protein
MRIHLKVYVATGTDSGDIYVYLLFTSYQKYNPEEYFSYEAFKHEVGKFKLKNQQFSFTFKKYPPLPYFHFDLLTITFYFIRISVCAIRYNG